MCNSCIGQIVKYHNWINGYDYTSMPDSLHYNNGVLPDFLLHIGEIIGIDYKNGSISATSDQLINACRKIGFNPIGSSFSYNISSSQLPMIVMGVRSDNPKKGHMWICDGYKVDKTNQHIYLMIPNEHPEDAMFNNEVYIPFQGKYYGYPEQYSKQYVHFNWGYYGEYDGWFYNNATLQGITYINLKQVSVK